MLPAHASDGCASHTYTHAEGDGFTVSNFVPAGAAITSMYANTTEAWNGGTTSVYTDLGGGFVVADPTTVADAYLSGQVWTVGANRAGVFHMDGTSPTTGVTEFTACYVSPTISSGSGGGMTEAQGAELIDSVNALGAAVILISAVSVTLTSATATYWLWRR